MCLNDDGYHPCPFISSLRAVAKQSRKILKKTFYFLKCYYKRYDSFWCRISSVFMIILVLMIGIHHNMDPIGAALLGFLIPLGAGIYKAHDDKDKKNQPVFKGRQECFHELRDIVLELDKLSSDAGDFVQNRTALKHKTNALDIKARLYFDNRSHTFKFIEQARAAIMDYLWGIDQPSDTVGRKGYMAAHEFLKPFSEHKEFLNRRREFELDIFKPETFAPIWAKSFNAVLNE